MIQQQDKIKLPKQTEFGLKQPLSEDSFGTIKHAQYTVLCLLTHRIHQPRTPSDQIQNRLAQPCELPPLLHKLTYNTKITTHKREKSTNDFKKLYCKIITQRTNKCKYTNY